MKVPGKTPTAMRLLPYDWEFGLFPVVSGMVHSAFAAPRSPLTLQPARLLHAMCPSPERVHTHAAANADPETESTIRSIPMVCGSQGGAWRYPAPNLAARGDVAGAQLGAAPGRYTNPRTCLPHALSVGPPPSVHSVPR